MASTEDIIVCANCGKGEESAGDLKACTACKLVKYCNRDCQIAHRPQHKKACKKRAAELYDEMLFNDPPPREDCPICFLPLPFDPNQTKFQSCCGQYICVGCFTEMMVERMRRGKKAKDQLCPYCRELDVCSDTEKVRLTKKLMENGNANAFYVHAGRYIEGTFGMRQDWTKTTQLWLKAGELGCGDAYRNLGWSYYNGRGVNRDEKKAKHFYELAAMKGDVNARHWLGLFEEEDHRAYKHFMLAAKVGYEISLGKVKEGFMKGFVTKDEYEQTLRAYHKCVSEMKSEARDKGAAVLAASGYHGVGASL